MKIQIRRTALCPSLYRKIGHNTCCLLLCLVATAITIDSTTTVPGRAINGTCLSHCTYIEPKIECNGCIPQTVPNGTEDVSLVNLHLNYLFAGFCSVTWPHVNSLAITTEDGVWYRLGNGVFDCLGYLRSFRLSSRYLVSFDYGTFTGLTNLTTFDISGCQRITLENVYEILYWSNSFPFLTHVLLASVNPSTLQVIDQKFIDALSTRRITYIDLSNNYLGLTFTSANILCNSLHTLVIRDASLFFEIEFWRLGKCSSLQVYDNSGTGSITPLSCINDTWLQISHTFFKAVKVLFSNRKIHSPTMSIANCTLDFCSDSSIEELHFAENNLPSFEFKMKNPRIKFLNLSHNKIENINRDAVRYLPSLTRLDLSNNDLSETNAFDTISHLFRYNTQLRDIDLSANNLEFLPNETFANKAHLELMNLSSNAFDQIHFHFWNLPNLTTIDLSFNKMVNLDSHSRHSLDNWYRFHPEKHESVSLILHGNPFSCSCSSLDFVKWFVASPIFSSPPARQYFCHIDNQRMPLTVNAVQGDCDRIRKERLQIILESTLIPISLIVLLVLAVVLYRRYKRKQREKLQDDRIRLLRENEAMFAVFLSHSSDENEFVRNNILKPLQEGLRNLTKLDRALVCHADRHFVPGRTIMAIMFRCLDDCPVFLAVVSKSFCDSRYCRHEIETAHTEGKPIILIFKEHVPEDKMDHVTRKVFNNFTRVKCVFGENGVDLQPSWDILCQSIIELIK